MHLSARKKNFDNRRQLKIYAITHTVHFKGTKMGARRRHMQISCLPRLVLWALLQNRHVFYMPRLRKQVEWLKYLYIVSGRHEEGQIASLSVRSARNIHELFRTKSDELLQKGAVASGARRVYYHRRIAPVKALRNAGKNSLGFAY